MVNTILKKLKKKMKYFRIYADRMIYECKAVDEEDAKIKFEYDKGVVGVLKIEEVKV